MKRPYKNVQTYDFKYHKIEEVQNNWSRLETRL